MHRLSRLVAVALLLATSLLVSQGCGTTKHKVSDPAYIDRLRIRITKVRNAIQETRRTIALSNGAAYLPELYVRLAELQSEEARYHYQVAYEREQRASAVIHAPQVRFLKEESIKIYRMVIQRYPKSLLRPRVLFNIGHELRELGRYDDMLKTLQQLVTEHAAHPLTPEALLVLGDYWFDKGKLDQAETFYVKIIRSGLQRVSGLARYKMGWVWVNRANCKDALSSFDKAIKASTDYLALDVRSTIAVDDTVTAQLKGAGLVGTGGTSQSGDIDVRRMALVDAMYCFAREKPWQTAIKYLKKKSYNRATYIAALERLAARYAVLNEANGSIVTTRELLALAPTDPDRLDDARLLYGAIKQAKSWDRVGADVTLITDAMKRQVNRVETTTEMRDLTIKEFEQYTRDLVTRAQASVNKDADKGKKVPMAVNKSIASGYASFLDAFPNSAATADITLNLADVLSEVGDSMAAGQRYAQAAAQIQDPTRREGALYDSVVEFQKSLALLTERDQVERVVVRSALRRSARLLMAYKLAPDKARNVKLAIGQTHYDEGDFGKAIERLSAVAYEYPKTEESTAAINLILDSYNILNDYDALDAVGRRFMAAASPASDVLKGEIKKIVTAANQRKLDEVSLAAAGDGGGDTKELDTFIKRYEGTDLGERALINAFVAARAQGDAKRLFKLGQELIAKYPKSKQAPGVIATLAKTAMATFDYDQALQLYAQAAKGNPDQAVQLLIAAGEIHEQFASTKQALRAYQKAVQVAKQPQAKSKAAAKLAELVESLGDDNQTVAVLAPLKGLGNSEVLARLGMAYVHMGKGEAAEDALGGVLSDAAASEEAKSRAQFGTAEALTLILLSYTIEPTLDSVQEYMTLLEVVEQSYLNAARQGSPTYTPAALARLAYVSSQVARKLAGVKTPPDVAGANAKAFKSGLTQRVKALNQTANEALKACAAQAWTNKVFTTPVRVCLKGQLPAKDPVTFDKMRPRTTAAKSAKIEKSRTKLAKNAKDLETLRDLGGMYLDAGDAHMARLVFARAVQNGGGPEDLNLLGVASFKAGDTTGALDAFAQAADGGLEMGRQNLSRALGKLGLSAASKTALKKWPEGKGAGRSL